MDIGEPGCKTCFHTSSTVFLIHSASLRLGFRFQSWNGAFKAAVGWEGAVARTSSECHGPLWVALPVLSVDLTGQEHFCLAQWVLEKNPSKERAILWLASRILRNPSPIIIPGTRRLPKCGLMNHYTGDRAPVGPSETIKDPPPNSHVLRRSAHGSSCFWSPSLSFWKLLSVQPQTAQARVGRAQAPVRQS